MSRICLDTSAYIDFCRGNREAAGALDQASWVGVPVVTLGELRVGIMLSGNEDERGLEVAAFLRNPVVEVLMVDAEVARLYSEILVDLRRRGTPIPTNDIWIAACAVACGAPVLTRDSHFARIRRVGLWLLGD